MPENEILSKLQSFEVFKDVPEDQLLWFIREGEVVQYQPYDHIWEVNDVPVKTYVVLSGQIEIIRYVQGEGQEVSTVDKGQVTGFLPYSRMQTSFAAGIATEPSEVFTFPREKIPMLISQHFQLTQALVSVMTTRVKDLMERQKQNEKMMALGKLSAGLAHELNNPIAAIIRSSEALQKHLKLVPVSFKEVICIRMTPEEVDAVNDIMFSKISEPVKEHLSPIERSDREDEIVDWLENLNVENTLEISENMVEFGFAIADLELFTKYIPKEHFNAVINWINSNLITEKTVKEIKEGSTRISALIQSVKTYTHMDRGKEKQQADIHDGIRNTLVMLAHKIKKGNIQYVENFAQNLPQINIMAGEMNQVWTNLIDNAIDAMDEVEEKVLEICTRMDKGYVKVEIIDSGKGIPPAIKDRIFEPFFTTKEVGRGTGLGLDLVMSIIKQHRGLINVNSVPGKTNFEICLPLKINS